MKKIDLELALMDPEKLKVLSERSLYLKNRYGEHGTAGGEAAERVSIVEKYAHDLPQTVEEIQANDHDFITRSDITFDLSRFIEEYRTADPRAVVRTLTSKPRKTSTLSEELILENMINRLTIVREATEEDEEMIGSAIEILMSTSETEK